MGRRAVEHPALVGLQDVAEQAAPAADLLDQLRVLRDGDAGDHVAEAGEILGRRVEAQVGAELERMLEGGAQKRVVHHHHGAVRDGGGRRRRRGGCRS